MPGPGPGPASYRAMTEGWEPHAERALRIAGIGRHRRPVIREVWTLLRDSPPSTPCLCHSDPAGDKVMVSPSHTLTLVDWEWASANDPAGDVAYWSFWHDGAQWGQPVQRPPAELLDALLTGYEPEDLSGFRRRALASRVWTAIDTIHVYAETPDPDDPTQGLKAGPEGIVFAGQKLEGYLRERAWEHRA